MTMLLVSQQYKGIKSLKVRIDDDYKISRVSAERIRICIARKESSYYSTGVTTLSVLFSEDGTYCNLTAK